MKKWWRQRPFPQHPNPSYQSPQPSNFSHAGRRILFRLPACGARISMLLDLSVRRQAYIEDCEVCCRPLEISYVIEDEFVVNFSARPGIFSKSWGICRSDC
ncbi:MAG: CPXCG motif-containing cysteine-rich protein [Chloroflexi bacterium]|nr:CPXCG motif-containing cysteine-rich protein [Chloroflexota bacterium]MBK6708943.1 CPXCG motif-containing cysteine-rich protein [Chloroflexota bacterium]MBK8934447.1 CPXCG motif-containing cysteine-rich protein [Chloroflexota bacterium]MBP6805121.1 CPXCG motif-containing cysteine-rich protein [Chloroflexota bacterium]MBP7590028.1 CPXCG motif-containing cysteine-rich protein [Chloroflexota bacterium]